MNADQYEILRVPLHLFLFIEAAGSRELGFASIEDLFDAYWREKQTRVANRSSFQYDGWTTTVSALCEVLSKLEALSAPDYELVDTHFRESRVLASESVLRIHENVVSFFHESFFDYAFGRCFLNDKRDLTEWLTPDRQGFFRRRQVVAVLSAQRRRASEAARYASSLERILTSSAIRFHIKKRVLEWLGELPDPTPEEWDVIERTEPELGDHIWGVPWNSAAWFDVLLGLRRWGKWLRGNNASAEKAIHLLGSPKVLRARPSAVVALIDEHRDDSAVWWDRAWGIAVESGRVDIPEIQSWVLGLIASEPLGSVKELDRRSRWISAMLLFARPEFAARVIGAWFDRERGTLVRAISDKLFGGEIALRIDGWEVAKSAREAPEEFAAELFPRIASVEQEAPLRVVGMPRADDHGRNLYDFASAAMKKLATSNPNAFRSIANRIDARGDYWTRWMCIAYISAMCANPTEFAEEVNRFIVDDPDRRLDLGYAFGSGGGGLSLAISRPAVKAVSVHCTEEAYAHLENAILSFQPPHGAAESVEGKQLALLRCLPEGRISIVARERIEALERKLPTDRRATRQGDGVAVGFEWGESAISTEETLSASNHRWIEMMQRYSRSADADRNIALTHDDSFDLSRQLEKATRNDPGRFAALAVEMDESIEPVFFEGIVNGLTRGDQDAPRPGTFDQVSLVLRRIAELGIGVNGQVIARAIGSLADEPISNELIGWLCQLAEHPSPPSDDWIDSLGPMAAITQAINSVRGVVAKELGRLLIADPNRWEVVAYAVNRLVADPVLAVRSTAARCLLAIIEFDRPLALNLFGRLLDGGDSLIDSHYVDRFIGRATWLSYSEMRPTLQRLLHSGSGSAARIAARHTVLASLYLKNEQARLDEAELASMGEAVRAGAADVYAGNVADDAVMATCVPSLCELFNDRSGMVRKAAARCWANLSPDQIADQGRLLREFANSPAFESHSAAHLAHRLSGAVREMPKEICDLVEKALATFGERAYSPRYLEAGAANELAKLTFRLHDETRDAETRLRAQDCIDRMIEANFFGVLDELERRQGV
ncbi:MAG: hypothetical protein F4Z40_01165 [Chloroflexi bacterium]|nr:hypothetical protein [Chloroflexota bacterium]